MAGPLVELFVRGSFINGAYPHKLNRPGVARAFLKQPRYSFIHSVSQSVSQPFPPNYENIINHKQKELES